MLWRIGSTLGTGLRRRSPAGYECGYGGLGSIIFSKTELLVNEESMKPLQQNRVVPRSGPNQCLKRTIDGWKT